MSERDAETLSLLRRSARHLHELGVMDVAAPHLDRGLVKLLRDLARAGFTGRNGRSLDKVADWIEEANRR